MKITGRNFHFIAGLPRSGSTLLSAILQQNPKFNAGISSAVASFFTKIIDAVSAGSEHAITVSTQQRKNLLRGLFDNFYAELPKSKQLVFDTNRSWTSNLPALTDLFPQSRVICCVRDVAWVLDSLERQFRGAKYDNTALFKTAAERSSVFTRTEALMGRTRLVGSALCSLKEAMHSEQAGSILIVDYDHLVHHPKEVLSQIYSFLGEPAFDHDFQNVGCEFKEFDRNLGLEDLHTVRAEVRPLSRQTILPPELFKQYSALSFWRDFSKLRDAK